MRKIKLKHDMDIPGWGFIPKGTAYNVYKFNSRFVYVKLLEGKRPNEGTFLRLARKGDCEVMY